MEMCGRFVRDGLLVVALASVACGGRALEASDDAGRHISDPRVVDATVIVAPIGTVPSAEATAPVVEEAIDASLDEGATDAPADAGAVIDADPWAGLDAGGFASDAGRCGTGIVTFRIDPGPGGPWWVARSGDEEPNGLALFTASGTRLDQFPAEMTAVCGMCEGWGVPIGISIGELGDAGMTDSWDGVYYVAGTAADGSCPGSVPMACMTQECAPPGEYMAEMCACSGPDAPLWINPVPPYSLATCDHPTCVRVPFLYPSPAVVEGTIVAQ
jgi:hypothetical protein